MNLNKFKFGILLIGLVSCLGSLRAQTIAEHFLAIPNRYFSTLKEFTQRPFTQETKMQIIDMNDSSGYIDFQIERKSGYMSFVTKGDGENRYVELALWNLGDDKLLIMTISVIANCTEYTKDVFIFQIKQNKLFDLTSQLLPRIQLNDFFNYSKFHEGDLKNLQVQGIKWNWELPRIGRSIRIIAPSYDCDTVLLPPAKLHYEVLPLTTHKRLSPKIISNEE